MPNGIKRTKQERNRIMNAKEMFRVWMDDPYYDEATKAELKEIEGNDMEIEARFCRSLSFGTGGLRGILGAGTNRMNIYTVRKATQGLAEYILEQKAEKKGVAIAFDSRNMSSEFAEEAALTLAANKIRAYVFPSLRPTPMLSFAVRELGCTAGIVQASISRQAIIRRNTTDIKYTGKTAGRSLRPKTGRLSKRSMRLRRMPLSGQ